MTFVSQWQTSIGKFGKVNLRIAESRTRVYLDINGKIFPGGTLPSGAADFDPTQPFNGVEPIGEGINRGQNGAPFSPDIASSYSSAPDSLGTEYFILNDGRALTR